MIYIENILLCLIIPLGVSLIFLKGKVRRFRISFMCGMVACLFAAYIGGFIQDVSGLELEDVSIFLSPIIEEFLKFLPKGGVRYRHIVGGDVDAYARMDEGGQGVVFQ